MALVDYYNTGDDTYANVLTTNWVAMTFTTTSAYSIGSVKLKIYKTGTPPANVLVSIRATTAGVPSGADLTTGSIAGSTLSTDTAGVWTEIPLTPYSLSDATKYAIVVTVDTSSFQWRLDNSSPTYAGGNACTSGNGSSWTTRTYDMMFETYDSASYADVTGTIAGTSGVSGFVEVLTSTSVSGTIAATSSVSGAVIVSSNWQTGNFKSIKRLIVIGNDSLYYESV